MAHYELDARHLLCPMPVIKTQNRTKTLAHGDHLTVIATDPGAQHDLPCWCRINGHKILSSEIIDGEVFLKFEVIKDEG